MSVRTALPRLSTAPGYARRLLIVLVVALAATAATVGVRAVAHRVSAPAAGTVAPSAFPTSPAIEQRWGIRFTRVNILADSGIIEVRYIVLDDGKTGRMHSGKTADLPVVHSETSGLDIRGNSALFHMHTDNSGSSSGHAFSILYGNANGAVTPGSAITIILADGLRLEHVPVAR